METPFISDDWPLNGRQINAPTLVKQQPRRQKNPENRPTLPHAGSITDDIRAVAQLG